jgi:CubicO group peptidase (beta-lactamase class C family)
MLPTLVGKSTEEYLQENVLRPLGMTGTTFYPFDRGERLMPLRYGRGAEEGKPVWEELNGQMDLLTLPRK